MENLAKDLLAESDQSNSMPSSLECGKTKRAKPFKCLVYWIADKQVSIVRRSNIRDVEESAVETNKIYDIKYQDKKFYRGKILKISDDMKTLKEMEKEVAESLATASAGATTSIPSTKRQRIHISKDAELRLSTPDADEGSTSRHSKSGNGEMAQVSSKSRKDKMEVTTGAKKNKNNELTQVAARAQSQREVFRSMLANEDMSSSTETDMNGETNVLSGRKAPEVGERAISQPCDVTPVTSAVVASKISSTPHYADRTNEQAEQQGIPNNFLDVVPLNPVTYSVKDSIHYTRTAVRNEAQVHTDATSTGFRDVAPSTSNVTSSVNDTISHGSNAVRTEARAHTDAISTGFCDVPSTSNVGGSKISSTSHSTGRTNTRAEQQSVSNHFQDVIPLTPVTSSVNNYISHGSTAVRTKAQVHTDAIPTGFRDLAPSTSNGDTLHKDIPNSSHPYQSVMHPKPVYPYDTFWSPHYQPSFGEQLRSASLLTNGMDPFQQEQVVEENMQLKREVAQLKEDNAQLVSKVQKLEGVAESRLPVVTAMEIDILEKLVTTLKRECGANAKAIPISHSGYHSLESSADESSIDERFTEEMAQDSEDDANGSTCSQKTSEPTVELFPGANVFMTQKKYALIMLHKATKKPQKLTRLLLVTLFSSEELENGCALGSRSAVNKTSNLKTRPLDPRKVEAVKVFVNKLYKKDGIQLQEKEFNRIINCKCSEMRLAAKKAAS